MMTRNETDAKVAPSLTPNERGILASSLLARQDTPRPSFLLESPHAVVAAGMGEAVAREIARRWNAHDDLLAALTRIVSESSPDEYTGEPIACLYPELMAKVEAAIAKAKATEGGAE